MSHAIILGDPHLGKGASSLGKSELSLKANSKIQDQFKLLDWVLDQAIDKYCSHIIITGDIFEDPKPHQEIVIEFIKWLNYCSYHDVNVHIIYGNHDIFRTGKTYQSSLEIIDEANIPGVHCYNDFTNLFIDNCGITIAPFRDKKSYFVETPKEALYILENILFYQNIEIPNFYHKICIGHLALEGSIPVGDEFDDLLNELICPLSLFENYSHVWMGHVHTPQVLSNSPYMSHIGSMDISNFGESEQIKHITILNCEDATFEDVVIPTKKLNKIVIDIPEDINDATEFVMSKINNLNVKNQIVKIEISSNSVGTKAADKKEIEKLLISKGVYSISSVSESKKVNIVKKTNSKISFGLDVKESIKKFAEDHIPENIRQESISLMFDIYNSLEK